MKAILAGILMLASGTVYADDDKPVPEGFVDLGTFIPDIAIDARYAGSDNFVGRPVEGYMSPRVIISQEAARALKDVQAQLKSLGMTLKVFDGYRPQRAVDDFMAWVKNKGDTRAKDAYYPGITKDRLVPEGYIAEKSGHSRGSTVDVTIAKFGPDGTLKDLDMGSPWDFFGPVSNPGSMLVSEQVRANREQLSRLMQGAGFKPYDAEWWHFTLENEPYPSTYFDFPVE